MALTSASTLSSALAQANDNLAWEGSPTKAADLLEAVRWLGVNRPLYSMESGSQITFEKAAGLDVSALSAYVSATKTGSSQGHFVRMRPR